MFSLLISSSSEFPNNKNNLVKMLMIINFELFSNSFLGKEMKLLTRSRMFLMLLLLVSIIVDH